ncbi:MAG: hypothetical protein FWG90_10245 [Oscillospiraceae bacterium]|nr:hypothetical protein [Oscillospiraceae bacterium]
MNKYQTMQEIEREYDGNWVCIINYKKDEFYDIIGGEVIAVSKDKDEIRKVWRENTDSYKQYCGDFGEFLGATGGFLF